METINPKLTEIKITVPTEQLNEINRLDNKNRSELYANAMQEYLNHFFSDQPNVLFKYRDWVNNDHQKTLKSNEFFLLSPRNANDPFDMRISLDYDALNTREKIGHFLDYIIQSQANLNVRSALMLSKEKMIDDVINNPQKLYVEHAQKYIEGNDKNLGFFCLSERWNSVLMWSHYSNCHKGFCIGLNKQKLIESSIFGAYGPTSYVNNFPKVDPLTHLNPKEILIETFTKAWEWVYEKEYRFVKIFDTTPQTMNERKFFIEDDFFKELIIGLYTPIQHEKEIRILAQKKKIPTYKINKEPNSFILTKKLLD